MTKDNKDTIEGAEKLIRSSMKHEIVRIIPKEERYVRRTTEEFKAGAEPVRDSGSHRMKATNVLLIPELHTAIKQAAKKNDVTLSLWLRAALRKALREGVDVQRELDTEIVLGELSQPASSEP